MNDNKELCELVEAVDELNDQMWEDNPKLADEGGLGFSVEWFSVRWIVKFNDAQLFSSESGQREWIDDKDDYEPILVTIKREFNRLRDSFVNIKI